MRVTYKNPGFEHSVDSILLFQEDDTTPYWSDALIYFFPQLKKEKIDAVTRDGKKEYLTEELKSVWDVAYLEVREAVPEDDALKKPIFLPFLDLGLFPVFFF